MIIQGAPLVDRKLGDALHCLFEQGRDPMFITNKRGVITHVNPAFSALYMYEESEILGKSMGALLKNPLNSVIHFKRILRTLLSQGVWKGELHVISNNGEIIMAWTQIVQVEDGFAVTQIDLRERDKITQKMEGLSRLNSVAILAGGVAHEFNNILAGIQGHLYLFKRQWDADQQAIGRLQRIDGLMQRAVALVHNLLAFSKQKKTVSQEVSLVTLLEEIMAMAKKTLDSHIVLTLSIKERGLMVYADPVVLKQHVFELISNAEYALLQQRHDHHGQVIVDVEHIDVQVGLDAHGAAEILLRDNGGGMQGETIRHCLEPFFTTKPVGQGSGLGLSSAVAYMQQLKGSLHVESVYGEYTVVRITLPLATPMAVRKAGNGLILLVDDDDDFRQAIEEILAYHGYEVLAANNGLAALSIWRLHQKSIDAVVMDIIMPSMDGLEVAHEIRRDNQEIPVCLTTGYSNQKIPVSLNVNLLRKPLNPDVLIEYLEQFITAKK